MIWFALIVSVLGLLALFVFVTHNLLLRIEKLENVVSELSSDDEDCIEDDPEIIELLNSEVD